MIPPFDEHGYLPPGIHPATSDEIDARFGHESELRQVQLESLRWFVYIAQRAGVKRLIVNGSFVTDELQELSLRSLKRMINPLKEEIARFESQAMHGSAS